MFALESPAISSMADRASVLRARGLGKTFGKVRAVDDLDLDVRQGEIYGFLGTNGAGKTTTIRMIMGIIKPDSGVLELLGQSAKRTTIAQKRLIGYVSQEQTFYAWMSCASLGRFVAGFYPTWDASEFNRLLEIFGLPSDRKVSQLSGGMRVKLALALALAPRPPLLILDEPTSGLDALARREFLELVQDQARTQQRTTFFSSHRIDEIEMVADRVGIIHEGKLRYEGTIADLIGSVRMVVRHLPVRDLSEPPPLTGNPSEFVELPPEFQILKQRVRDGVSQCVARGRPEAWAQLELPGSEIVQMSLEDIFIAMVSRSEAK